MREREKEKERKKKRKSECISGWVWLKGVTQAISMNLAIVLTRFFKLSQRRMTPETQRESVLN
jgi:hypothetical protein